MIILIVYATHKGGKYLPFEESLKIEPINKRGLYVNITNQCNCDCVFCLRQKKNMNENATLWLKSEPTIDEIKSELLKIPKQYVNEIVFCGFGEPTLRLNILIESLKFIKENFLNIPTRLNTNGLCELEYKREIAQDFKNILDTVSISLNAATAEKYFKLTRAKYGLKSYESMLKFAEHMKNFVPNVILTIVDHVTNEDEIERCKKICAQRNLNLRIRAYEDD